MLDQYEQWLSQSKAIFVLDYARNDMKAIDTLRRRARESGGEIHIGKNTLFGIVLEKIGMDQPQSLLEGSSIIGFAFSDAPVLAKVISEVTAKSEVFKVKGGYLGTQKISAAEIKALGELPPLPVMRAKLMGTLLAPASKLVRTLAEPARSLAGVVKAYSEKEAAPAA
jgi:large subunit ribosomal protein L10